MIRNIRNNLGFIKRTCGTFSNPLASTSENTLLFSSSFQFRILLVNLVKYLNNTLKQNSLLESIQNNFLRFMRFKCNVPPTCHCSYDSVLNFFLVLFHLKTVVYPNVKINKIKLNLIKQFKLRKLILYFLKHVLNFSESVNNIKLFFCLLTKFVYNFDIHFFFDVIVKIL